MEPRVKSEADPDVIAAIGLLNRAIHSAGVDPLVLELVHLRASQVNGCSPCVFAGVAAAKKRGETDERLHNVVAWRETPFYTDRERAALEWTESLTLVSQTHVPDEVYESVKQYFSEKEIVDLSILVSVINVWNRLAISTRTLPGTYKAQQAAAS